ncbi:MULTISPECIES: transposase [Methylocystis]|uniref:transposase n=1 Tax=Methylocystis TaxID=133 RepID=UPI0018A6B668|nr:MULTISPECIES: transposase [Methylocystis]
MAQQHPKIEAVSRDRRGLYAQGVRQGVPQARQITHHFHLLQNWRESIERHMTRASHFAGRPNFRPSPKIVKQRPMASAPAKPQTSNLGKKITVASRDATSAK